MISGRGPTVEAAFTQVAQGAFALAMDPRAVEEVEARVVRAHGVEAADLLVNWLNECLYVMEVEGFLARRVEITTASLKRAEAGGEPLRLHGLLHGEELDHVRHASVRTLTGFSRQGASVRQDDKGYEATAKTCVQSCK